MIGHALDEFIADWSEAEEQEFLGEVAVFEQVDESLWEMTDLISDTVCVEAGGAGRQL